jgi:hypothetical protein
MGKIIRLDYDCYNGKWSPIPSTLLEWPIGDPYLLRLKLINAPTNIEDFETPLLLFKTLENFVSGGNFTAVFSSFDDEDTDWHLPANYQFSIPFILSSLSITSDKKYYLSTVLMDELDNRIQTSPYRFWAKNVMYQGTEASIPQGVITMGITDTVQITGSDTSKTIIVDGLTKETGKVVLTQEVSSAGYITPWVSIPDLGGEFTIGVPTAPEITPGDGRTFTFNYLVYRK